MFNTRLKELRKSKNITQKVIAKEINLSERSYQDLEYGVFKPSYETLIALAEYLDVSIDYLTERTDNPNINK